MALSMSDIFHPDLTGEVCALYDKRHSLHRHDVQTPFLYRMMGNSPQRILRSWLPVYRKSPRHPSRLSTAFVWNKWNAASCCHLPLSVYARQCLKVKKGWETRLCLLSWQSLHGLRACLSNPAQVLDAFQYKIPVCVFKLAYPDVSMPSAAWDNLFWLQWDMPDDTPMANMVSILNPCSQQDQI